MALTKNEFTQYEYYAKQGEENMLKAIDLQRQAESLFTEADGLFHRTLLFGEVKDEIRGRVAYARQNPFDGESALAGIAGFLKGTAWMTTVTDDLRLYLFSPNFLGRGETLSHDSIPAIRKWAAKNLTNVKFDQKDNPLRDKISEAFDAYAVHILAKFFAPDKKGYEDNRFSDFLGMPSFRIPRNMFTVVSEAVFTYSFSFRGMQGSFGTANPLWDNAIAELARLLLVVYNLGRSEIYTRGGLPTATKIGKSIDTEKECSLVKAKVTVGEDHKATLTLDNYSPYNEPTIIDLLNDVVRRFYADRDN